MKSFSKIRATFRFAVCCIICMGGCPNTSLRAAESPADLAHLIKEALIRGEKRIVIPPGRYRVTPEKRTHLSLKDVKDVEIIAEGVEMICTETTRAITIDHCENLTIRGLTIDYDPLPYSQGKITSVSADKSSMEVQMLGGYPTEGFKTGSVEIFDGSTKRLRGRETYFQTTVRPGEKPGTVRLIKAESNPQTASERVDDIAVFASVNAPGGVIPHAIYSEMSRGLTFENITLYASPTFGFLENQCDGSRYIGCRVDRRPADQDLAQRELPRMRSTNADAYHSKNSKQGPLVEKCAAHYMGDDAVAINGDFHLIARSEGDKLRVLAKSDLTIQIGDTVQILTYDGVRLPDAKVISITPDGEIKPDEREFLLAQKMDERTKTTMMKTAYTLALDRPVDAPLGSVICSADRIGNGFIIRNCDLGMNRSRGIIVKAGRGEIRNNTIEGSVMESILISPEYWWMEAGFTDSLTIDGNRILDGGRPGVTIRAESGNGDIAPAGAFQNITFRNNTVTGCPIPSVLITSVKGLTLAWNQIKPDPKKKLEQWEIGKEITAKPEPLMLFNCEDVKK